VSISFTGLDSVLDRTLFTRKGPIVKSPLPLVTGAGLTILSSNTVSIPTGTFTESNVGHTLSITGSPDGGNDGLFPISQVLSATKLKLSGRGFDVLNFQATTARIVELVNDLKRTYELHRTQAGVHGTNDTFNPVSSAYAVDFPSAVILMNELRTKSAAHLNLVGPLPPVHKVPDEQDQILLPVAHDMASALLLVNALRRSFEAHRQNLEFHLVSDTVNRVNVKHVRPVLGSGPTTGPFAWTVFDPRTGQIADDPSDVSAKVNGSPVSIDAVFGLLGAVVLTSRPTALDSVSVDYGFMPNIPVQLKRTNSFEFGLNQFGNGNFGGLPEHRYRARSYLPDPDRFDKTVSSPFQPKRVGWKYKALERAYSACLNDPTTLLLNVPSNKTFYPVLSETVGEVTVRYDPTTLPQNAVDPWIFEGSGNLSLAPGGTELKIVDITAASGPNSRPPFFTHAVSFEYESITSAAFRAKVDVDETSHLQLDGANTGVGFGLSDGAKVALFGFVVTKATNLSSAIVLANSLKAKFDAHLVLTGTHRPNDPGSALDVVDATSLGSLIILVNRIKKFYNSHLAKGPVVVHQVLDVVNTVSTLDADDEATATALVNELYDKYNAHLVQYGVHYVNDGSNAMVPARQVGILTNRGFPEFDTSWNSYAVDWSQYSTYRISRVPGGKVSLFLTGFVEPIAVVEHADLPLSSSMDLRLDPMQQVFFGSVGAQPTSTSRWSFVRANVTPVDANQIENNKSVDYFPAFVPELDPVAPWITVGQAGFDRVSGGVLISDSTASADQSVVENLGLTTGAYKGYLRLEPILAASTACVVEFQASLGFWTHSLDNKAAGVFIDDGIFSTQFVFLQATPTPATVSGTSPEPYGIAANDLLILAFGNELPVTIQFPAPVTTAADAAAVINEALGFSFASTVTSVNTSGPTTVVKLTDSTVGAASKFQLIGGDALTKLGMSPGTYFGLDSNPEPKVSWFGEDFPDRDFPAWTQTGGQTSELLNRTLRITDSSTSDFRTYVLANPLFTAPVLSASQDWKCDFRMKVLSFAAGDPVATGSGLNFCGGLVNLDEGPQGKNVEVQISQDQFGNPFLNVLSYNAMTGNLDSMAEFPFNWNDGNVHSYDVYTSKLSGLVLVLADNVVLGTFMYASLNPGFNGPSVSFGSGANAVSNADLSTAKSSIEWSSVSVFRDGKVSDPLAASRRYVGVYGGGDPSLLSSYYVHQVDWTVPHSYRLVRDPVHSVSVFIDGGDVPVISINYDPLKLPPSSSSFLSGVTEGRQCIAFGGFNPFELSRTIWASLKYSLGKLTLTDLMIPPHQVVNQANVVSSPEHLRTKLSHVHQGFNVYSGGTPVDDFLANADLGAATELNEGMAPVPLTQTLEVRGGLEQTITPVSTIPTSTFVNTKGFLSDFEDDTVNGVDHDPAVVESSAVPLFVARVNDLRARFNAHIVQSGVHYVNDVADQVLLPPSIDLATALVLLNDVRNKYLTHLFATPSHAHVDETDIVGSGPATDLVTGVVLVEEIVAKFASVPGSFKHIESADFHSSPDARDVIALPDAVTFQQALDVLASFKAKYNAHRSQSGVHSPDDSGNAITAADPVDLATANVFFVDVGKYNNHLNLGVGGSVHHDVDPANVFPGVGFPSPPYATEAQATDAANRLKRVYNTHIVQPGLHFADDAYNAVVIPDIDPVTISIVVLNRLRVFYNLHIVDPVYHTPDVIHLVLTLDAFDLPSAIVLANAMKVKFNLHFTYTAAHLLPDFLDLVVEPNAFDVRSLVVLTQALKGRYEGHRQRTGSHGHDDPSTVVAPVATDLISAVSLLNGLKAAYNVHRLDLQHHKDADVLHAVTAPDAVDMPTGIQLASDLKGVMNGHLVSSFHVVQDSTNTVVGTAGDVASLIVLANAMRASLLAHFVQVEVGVVLLHVHGNNDMVHVSTDQTAVGALVSVLERFKSSFNSHRVYRVSSSSVHSSDDVWNPLVRDATYSTVSPESFELVSIVDFTDDCVGKHNAHLVQPGVHLPADVVDPVPLLLHGPADVAYAIGQANTLKHQFNAHVRGNSYHKAHDSANFLTSSSARDPLTEAFEILSLVKSAYNAHVVRRRSHVKTDPVDAAVLPLTTALADLIAFANAFKALFNSHIAKTGVHVKDDYVDKIIAADASDLETLGVLTNEILVRYNAHLVRPGVHGSFVFIRLDPPNRVLYNSLKAFKNVSGVEGHMQSFSDDDTLHMGTLRQDRPHSLSYEGGTAPERVTFVSFEAEPYNLSDGDLLTVKLDDGPTDTYEMQASDVYAVDVAERLNVESCRLVLNEIRAAYNTHLAEPGVHSVDDTFNAEPLPPALDLPTCIALANHLRYYYNKHRVEPVVHDIPDTQNSVGAGYAFNLGQLIDLTASLRLAFEAHKIQAYAHAVNDTVNVVTRTGGGFAKDNGDGRVRLTSPTPGMRSSLVVGGSASVKLGLDVPQFTPWVIKSTAETDVQVLPVLGLPDYLNYGTVPATEGSATTYKSITGLTDPVSFDIDVTVSVRIHNAYIDDNGDSNVYVGMNGVAGPGFSVAIGFEVDVVSGGCYVKLQDLKANRNVFKRLFNWNDGQFHTYRVLRDAETNSMNLMVVE
jgi:hypothetical protein